MRQDKIKEIIQGVKGSHFFFQTNLITDGLISSFDLIEIISGLEEYFEVKFPYEKLRPENFDSIQAIDELIEKCTSF